MRIIFRAFLLFLGLFVVVGIVKFLFVKLFMMALWVGLVGLVIFVICSILKKAAT